MPLTVGQVIDLPVLQRGSPQILAKCRWSEPIRWIHVGEVADLSLLLRGGELVLTTGVGLRSGPRRYLEGLTKAGALGVIIELGATMMSVPDWVIALCVRLDLALVALHRQIKFVDVTETVHRSILAAQYDEVAFDHRVHETFTEMTMQRATLAAVVDAAARMLDRPVVLEDLAHQALTVSAGARREAASLLHEWGRRSRSASTSDGGEENWTVTTVGLRGEEWGRLIVPLEAVDPLRAMVILERAAAALALNRLIERNQTGIHQQAQSGLIEDVLQCRVTDDHEAAARAHALGLHEARRYFPMIVRVERDLKKADSAANQRNDTRVLDAFAHIVNAAGHTGLFSVRGPGEVGAILALSMARGDAEQTLATLGDRLRVDLRRVDGVVRSVCALGDPEKTISHAIRGLRASGHVAEAAMAMGDTPRSYFVAADVRLRGLIAVLRDDPRIQQFAETELRPLLVEDSGGHLSNMKVLQAYLALGGNKSALAQRLHLSRPALYKRLMSIGRILGRELDEPESVTSIAVAMMVLEAQATAGSTPMTDR